VVWDRFSADARRVLCRILGPTVDVEDQLQETFMQFFKDVHRLREPDKVRGFLIGIAVRLARSELRRRRFRRWLQLTPSGAVPEVASEGVDADGREAVTRLYACLDRIGDKERMIFVLRHIEGLELTEVAAALGLSLATTKRHLAKVTARVRAEASRDPVLAGYLDRTTPVPLAPGVPDG
jgi:RNA polymerase sigma-70 factor, ECF subfamily